VSAQIPCAYCVYATTKAAKAAGATDAQIKEAIATAALVRFNSTMLIGSDGGRDLPKADINARHWRALVASIL
jgi:AhpD family alkylhydroperoxidase